MVCQHPGCNELAVVRLYRYATLAEADRGLEGRKLQVCLEHRQDYPGFAFEAMPRLNPAAGRSRPGQLQGSS